MYIITTLLKQKLLGNNKRRQQQRDFSVMFYISYRPTILAVGLDRSCTCTTVYLFTFLVTFFSQDQIMTNFCS